MRDKKLRERANHQHYLVTSRTLRVKDKNEVVQLIDHRLLVIPSCLDHLVAKSPKAHCFVFTQS